MSPATIARVTPSVTSVCPPVTAMPSVRQARSMSRTMAMTCEGRVPGGRRIVGWNQQGRAPMTAMSLAFTWTTYQPRWVVVNVTGSLFSTSPREPILTTAASTPQPGPTSTRASFTPRQRSSRSSRAGGSFPRRSVDLVDGTWIADPFIAGRLEPEPL